MSADIHDFKERLASLMEECGVTFSFDGTICPVCGESVCQSLRIEQDGKTQFFVGGSGDITPHDVRYASR